MSDRNAMILVVIFGLILGVMNTLGTIIGIITNQYGYTEANASLFGAIFIFGGIIGSGVYGGFVEVTKRYKLATTIICWCTAITPISLVFALLS